MFCILPLLTELRVTHSSHAGLLHWCHTPTVHCTAVHVANMGGLSMLLAPKVPPFSHFLLVIPSHFQADITHLDQEITYSSGSSKPASSKVKRDPSAPRFEVTDTVYAAPFYLTSMGECIGPAHSLQLPADVASAIRTVWFTHHHSSGKLPYWPAVGVSGALYVPAWSQGGCIFAVLQVSLCTHWVRCTAALSAATTGAQRAACTGTSTRCVACCWQHGIQRQGASSSESASACTIGQNHLCTSCSAVRHQLTRAYVHAPNKLQPAPQEYVPDAAPAFSRVQCLRVCGQKQWLKGRSAPGLLRRLGTMPLRRLSVVSGTCASQQEMAAQCSQ